MQKYKEYLIFPNIPIIKFVKDYAFVFRFLDMSNLSTDINS